jgi:hypothetical protein
MEEGEEVARKKLREPKRNGGVMEWKRKVRGERK